MQRQESSDGSVLINDGTIMTEKGDKVPIVEIEHRIAFEKGTRRVLSLEVDFRDASGKQHRLNAKLSNTGIKFHGAWSGRGFQEQLGHLHLDGEAWDFNNRETVVSQARWLSHWLTEFQCDNEIGHGLVEYAVSKKHSRYGPAL